MHFYTTAMFSGFAEDDSGPTSNHSFAKEGKESVAKGRERGAGSAGRGNPLKTAQEGPAAWVDFYQSAFTALTVTYLKRITLDHTNCIWYQNNYFIFFKSKSIICI